MKSLPLIIQQFINHCYYTVMLLLWEALPVQLTSYGPLVIYKSGESIMLQLVIASTLHLYTLTHSSHHHWTLVILFLKMYISVKYWLIHLYLLQLEQILLFLPQVRSHVCIYVVIIMCLFLVKQFSLHDRNMYILTNF